MEDKKVSRLEGVIETLSIPHSHRVLRDNLEKEVANFLNNGGVVMFIEPGRSALSDLRKELRDASLSPAFKKVLRSKIYSVLCPREFLGLTQEELDETALEVPYEEPK